MILPPSTCYYVLFFHFEGHGYFSCPSSQISNINYAYYYISRSDHWEALE
ncbi:hypothetical protein SK3146_00116 [Paenibacillus konkukensis]|uniref:Uncharacterized protein n=1 Tax=Paenibacillus konkukensis TaxID=2020716 RepID=A0ABY4RFT1_9BACL|nr:hypothetical protein SK3146_00116 [Paenibacillus konkukensis]